MQFSSIVQSAPGGNDNEGVLCIPQSPSITATSPLMSYPGHLLGGVLTLCRGAVGVFYSPTRLDSTQSKCQNSFFSYNTV